MFVSEAEGEQLNTRGEFQEQENLHANRRREGAVIRNATVQGRTGGGASIGSSPGTTSPPASDHQNSSQQQF